MNAKTKTKTIVGWRFHKESLSLIANESINRGVIDQLFSRRSFKFLPDKPIKTRITITVTVEDL